MRAVTPEELEKIAGGLKKGMYLKAHPMLIKPPSSSGGGGGGGAPSGGGVPTGGGGTGWITSGGGEIVHHNPPPSSGTAPPPSNNPPGDGGSSGGNENPTPGEVVDSDVSFLQFGDGMATADGKPTTYLEQIFTHEANSAIAEVPADRGGHVTVSYGVEMAYVNQTELKGLLADKDISQSLYNELEKLTSLTGTNANNYYNAHPFTANDAEGLTKLSEVVYGHDMWQMNENLRVGTNGMLDLADLRPTINAALTDVTIRFGAYGGTGIEGTMDGFVPNGAFWKALTTEGWTDVAQELRDASDHATLGGDKGRLTQDANWVQDTIDNGFPNGSI